MRKELGERIRFLREQQGLTQTTFASMINMDRGYYGKIESGECNPTLDKLESIAEGLGISLSCMTRGVCEKTSSEPPQGSNEYYFLG